MFSLVMLEFIFPIIFINKHFQIAFDLSIKIFLVLIKTVHNLLITLSAGSNSVKVASVEGKKNNSLFLLGYSEICFRPILYIYKLWGRGGEGECFLISHTLPLSVS